MGEKIIYKFDKLWTLYVHYNFEKKWNIENFYNVMKIENNINFWELFNNFNSINYIDNQFFIMKDNFLPNWEENLDGGNVAFRIKMPNQNVINIWTDICLKVITNEFDNDKYHICGLSLNMKYNLINIKILLTNLENASELGKIIGKLYKYQFFILYNLRIKKPRKKVTPKLKE
jgi:hypothetical protein